MKKLSLKISQKPILSMIIVAVTSIAMTAGIIYSTNLKNAFTADGIYAIRGLQDIELRGDAELPLYEKAIGTLNEIPDNKALVIYSGFGKYIPGSSFCDLVYHGGVFGGDFYQSTVCLGKVEKGTLHIDSLAFSSFSHNKPEKLGLNEREKMVADASEKLNAMIN